MKVVDRRGRECGDLEQKPVREIYCHRPVDREGKQRPTGTG